MADIKIDEEMLLRAGLGIGLVGSEMCIRDSVRALLSGHFRRR